MPPPDTSQDDGGDALRVAYLGPPGTNTHAAALALFPSSGKSAAFEPAPTIRAVFEAVAAGLVDRGVVPIENSTEGGVSQTLECLLELPSVIFAEYVTEIHHFLLGRSDARQEDCEQVLSHPQALGQCRTWLEKHLPHAELVSLASTSAAAKLASQSSRQLAVAPELAAQLYGLEVLERNIEDREHNATRFIAIALQDAAPTGRDKTSIVFTTRHEQGALRRVLAILDDAGINLTRIESRPLPLHRWEYAFFTDFEGSRLDAPVAKALVELGAVCGMVKVLGSYPESASKPLSAAHR